MSANSLKYRLINEEREIMKEKMRKREREEERKFDDGRQVPEFKQ